MKFLMSHPRFFDVKYSINPWMDIKNKPNNTLACQQWRKLNQLLIALGAEVDIIDGNQQYPDLVFTANAGILIDNKFIPSNFKYKERRGESEIFQRYFAEHGFQIIPLPPSILHEGRGDTLRLDDHYIQGHGFRSSYESHEVLSDLLDVLIVPVELTNSHFYHLDTCFCSLIHPKNKAPSFIYYDGAFSRDSLDILKCIDCNKFNVPEDEANKFVCNAVQINNAVIISEGCPATTGWLEDAGFKVYTNDMSQFILSGGSSKCCTFQVA